MHSREARSFIALTFHFDQLQAVGRCLFNLNSNVSDNGGPHGEGDLQTLLISLLDHDPVVSSVNLLNENTS